MPKIAILDDYTDAALKMAEWDSLPQGFETVVFNDNLVEPEALVARLKDFEIICAMRERTPFTSEIFEKLPNLKLFITTGMRNASVDVAAARAMGVVVCGTQGSPWATAEHTWALLMAAARNIAHDDRMMRDGLWQTRMCLELRGKTLGLVGLGKIGGQVAGFAKAFGMDIIAWSQNLTQERCDEVGAELVSKSELFTRADFVTIHMVLSDRSRGLVTSDDLGRMKPDAFLVNTSRGPIVDQTALLAVLKAGSIRGAAIDVYDHEPLPTAHPFRSLDNVVISPHMGYVTEETYRIFHGHSVENIQAWHAGSPIREIA
jgi:phosphoglycerate dehydrogenase-like enzyme